LFINRLEERQDQEDDPLYGNWSVFVGNLELYQFFLETEEVVNDATVVLAQGVKFFFEVVECRVFGVGERVPHVVA
jgi:hypothetical protein